MCLWLTLLLTSVFLSYVDNQDKVPTTTNGGLDKTISAKLILLLRDPNLKSNAHLFKKKTFFIYFKLFWPHLPS